MKKSFMLAASIVLIFLFSYGFTNEEVGAKVGAYAPNITLTSNGKTVDIEKYRGEYVLLSLWSSYDASSRLRCNDYNAYVKSSALKDEKSINYLSVNLDDNEKLFNEIVRLDNLNTDLQYFAGEREKSLIDKFYNLNSGFNTYLINQVGKIVAINPTVDELNLLNR